jgi:hypothetical protein
MRNAFYTEPEETTAMVERYLFVKLLPEHSNDEGRRLAAREAQQLAAVDQAGSGVSVRVGLPADASAVSAWDLSLALGFESLDAADRFIAGPAYAAFAEAFLGDHGRVVKAWTFEIQTGS